MSTSPAAVRLVPGTISNQRMARFASSAIQSQLGGDLRVMDTVERADALLDGQIVERCEETCDVKVPGDHETFPPTSAGRPASLDLTRSPTVIHVRRGMIIH